MSFFQKLRAANEAREKIVDPNAELDDLFFSNAVAGEMGEACNIVKKLVRARKNLYGNFTTSTPSELGDEIADVIIYLDLLAAKYNLDIEKYIVAKFNSVSQRMGVKGEL